MPHMKTNGSKSATAAVSLLLLAGLVLAACGSSTTSSSSTSTTTAAKTPTTTTGGPAGAGAKRFAALRECLKKNGITLPQRTPGQRRRPGGGFLGGGAASQLPKGVSRAQYQAALKKCGGGAFTGRLGASPVFKEALNKFASCMRQNGINLPEPNTSGNGPVFNTKGLDTTSVKFKSAQVKCSVDLRNSFRGTPGAGRAPGAAPPGGAPSAG